MVGERRLQGSPERRLRRLQADQSVERMEPSKRQSGWQYWRSAAALSADAIRSRKSTTTRLFCTCRCAGPSARRPRAWAKAGAAKGAVASARPKPPKACLLDTLWGWSLVPPISGQFDSLVRLLAVPSTLTLAFCQYPLSAGCGRVRLVPRSTVIDYRCDATCCMRLQADLCARILGSQSLCHHGVCKQGTSFSQLRARHDCERVINLTSNANPNPQS